MAGLGLRDEAEELRHPRGAQSRKESVDVVQASGQDAPPPQTSPQGSVSGISSQKETDTLDYISHLTWEWLRILLEEWV